MFDPSGLYQLTIHPNDRAQADEYYHQTQTWIEGREGSKYTINLRNNSYNKILAIISVDGLDILEGKPAGHLSKGYVIGPQSNINIPGWKVDNSTAAEFFFSRSSKSYVSQIGGNVSNTGVIGAMIFKERAYQPPTSMWAIGAGSQGQMPANPVWGNPYSIMNSQNSGILRSSTATAAASSVGTGFGDATSWSTTNTNFVRENDTIPNAILAIYYESAKNLQKMGIQLRTKTGSVTNPFPAYTSGVTPPPGWTR